MTAVCKRAFWPLMMETNMQHWVWHFGKGGRLPLKGLRPCLSRGLHMCIIGHCPCLACFWRAWGRLEPHQAPALLPWASLVCIPLWRLLAPVWRGACTRAVMQSHMHAHRGAWNQPPHAACPCAGSTCFCHALVLMPVHASRAVRVLPMMHFLALLQAWRIGTLPSVHALCVTHHRFCGHVHMPPQFACALSQRLITPTLPLLFQSLVAGHQANPLALTSLYSRWVQCAGRLGKQKAGTE